MTALRPKKVEDVAKAMVDHWYRLAGALPWDKLTEGERDNWRGQARAAITAMREPTTVMGYMGLTATDALDQERAGAISDVWRAMIDAALR